MDVDQPPVPAPDLPQAAETSTPAIGAGADAATPGAGSSRPRRRPHPDDGIPLDDLLFRRVTTIKEGDNVLLKLPSDSVKAVVASKDGLVQLGKFGAFPSHLLLGLHYDITYEIVSGLPDSARSTPGAGAIDWSEEKAGRSFGQQRGKKRKQGDKGKGKGGEGGGPRSNPGWSSTLRPLKRQPVIDAVIDDIQETNEFIDDINDDSKAALLTQEEILELRAQGVTAEELIQKQMERHEQFGLKTDFSKEKWRKRKEKKFSQTITPMSPSAMHMTQHYLTRAPQSILHLRDDTLSQLLTLSNTRAGGRYLVVDDTGGLVTAAMMERMGAQGRILVFTENDSPPAWGVLGAMNFGEREMDCVRWLNWMEADESYERPGPPDEENLPQTTAQKTQNRLRRHKAQVAELNATRDELHSGNWDGLVLATELSQSSVLARLLPYLAGSATITVYSPYLQVLAEVLQMARKNPAYLAPTLTESWSRTYQVLPGRTHPLMSTSATGGYLFHAIRVHPAEYRVESNSRFQRRHNDKRRKGDKGGASRVEEGDDASSGLEEDELEV